MGDMRIGRNVPPPPPRPTRPVPPPPPRIDGATSVSGIQGVQKSVVPEALRGLRPKYPPPKPPAKTGITSLDVSTPSARQKELASIMDPQTRPRSGETLSRVTQSRSNQNAQNGANLVGVMKDPKFAETLEKFSPSMGQRFLQACGKSEGSVDGGRFKKNVGRMVPLVNIGVYGRDAVRAQQTKKALDGIAAHAEANDNPLAMQLAQSLGAHEKSKRNTQIISGAVSVVTTAVAFVPGAQAAPALTGASAAMATNLGANLAVQYTAAQAVDSSIRTLGGTAVATAVSYAQDAAVTSVDRHGHSVGKEKIGSGYGKLKVTARQDADGVVKLETEMGYQAARALVNYLGPGQAEGESSDSPRMQLRRSLGASDDGKTYSVPDDKSAQRSLASKLDPTDGRTDYLQMFFDIGVKGASMSAGQG